MGDLLTKATGAQAIINQLYWYVTLTLIVVVVLAVLVGWTWYLLQPPLVQLIIKLAFATLIVLIVMTGGTLALSMSDAASYWDRLKDFGRDGMAWLDARPLITLALIPGLMCWAWLVDRRD